MSHKNGEKKVLKSVEINPLQKWILGFIALFMDSKEAALRLLCHALLGKARNDNKNKDSRIVEIESRLCVCFGAKPLAVGFG